VPQTTVNAMFLLLFLIFPYEASSTVMKAKIAIEPNLFLKYQVSTHPHCPYLLP
jgi:hypothetical protein